MNPPHVRLLAPFLVIAALGLTACGDDDPVNPGPGTNPPTDNRMVVADPSFSTVIVDIFSRGGCAAAACHGTASSAGLDLATDPYADLVDIPSTQVASLDRVEPNNADDSYLVIKLEGTDARMQQEQMPRGGTPLDTIDINNIRNWINMGANNN